jgi:hypothetical protein
MYITAGGPDSVAPIAKKNLPRDQTDRSIFFGRPHSRIEKVGFDFHIVIEKQHVGTIRVFERDLNPAITSASEPEICFVKYKLVLAELLLQTLAGIIRRRIINHNDL